MNATGQSVNRQDGRLKVTGAAKYSAEWSLPNLAYAVPVQSTIAKGTIESFDLGAAQAAPGVLLVMSHLNRPKLAPPETLESVGMQVGESVLPFQSNVIRFNGQMIAAVVAETYEQARYAATLVKVNYRTETPFVVMEEGRDTAKKPKGNNGREAQLVRGTPDSTFASAARKIEATFKTPHEHHHPLEPHATIASWEGDKLTVYDASQGVGGPQRALAGMFGIPATDVRVVCHFTGGGFGTKGGVWPHTLIAAMAARVVGRPVKLALLRQHMTTTTGHRPATDQVLRIGSSTDGDISAMRHDVLTDSHEPSRFFETAAFASAVLYEVPNFAMEHAVVNVNIGAPTYMRAPGEAPGTFALEVAMDELAYALKLDPVELRLKNYAEMDPQKKIPWSSKQLRQCYARGAEMIGWKDRRAEPGMLKQGRYRIGYGVATATYPGNRQAAGARVRLYPDGRAVAAAGGNDIGTGAYTVFRQVTADALGLPIEKVVFELGDTTFPAAPVAGGSWLTASVAPAAVEAAEMALQAIAALAVADARSPLKGRRVAELSFGEGRVFLEDQPKVGETLAAVVQRTGQPYIEACARAETMRAARDSGGLKQRQKPPCVLVEPSAETDRDEEKYSFHSFGAQFCKVRVDSELGVVRILDWASVMDAGTILNPKTARNQIMGGVGFGIGMAMSEETPYDPRNGRPVARNLADYHVAAHADVPNIQVEFVNIPDPHINRLGVRGVGEIGIVGVPAAISNAIFNAIGRRLRELPITPDKVIG
ncbi:MAG: xanthine dehydrogenase family protein molybdopterin-binding subunit [Cytophagales bacterium]|nr:xanthine dehydrogenase family protein molybdopterin-binding subunit [Armatimonadota bacterium]